MVVMIVLLPCQYCKLEIEETIFFLLPIFLVDKTMLITMNQVVLIISFIVWILVLSEV